MASIYRYMDVLPLSAMVAVECSNVGIYTLFKAATLKGLSYYVFVFYSFVIATLVLLPLVFIFPRFVAQLCGYIGIEYSSPTPASAVSNLTPAFTFILAVIFRMEVLALRSLITQAKIMGTPVSISGALIVVFYKGPAIMSVASQEPPLSHHFPLGASQTKRVIGSLLLATQYLLASIWYIVHAQLMKIYPAEFIQAFLFFLCATIVSTPVCLIAEGNLSAFRLRPDIVLAAIIYSIRHEDYKRIIYLLGIGLSLSTVVHTWGLHLEGACPLSIAIAAVMTVIFLGDALYLGRYTIRSYSSKMEVLALRSLITQAKIMGTPVSISGALIVVFYKGPAIMSVASQEPPLSHHFPLGASQTKRVIGSLLLATQYLLASIWYIVHAQLMKIYPAEFIQAFLFFLCATIVSTPVCLIAEGNLSAFRLRPDIVLAAIIYSIRHEDYKRIIYLLVMSNFHSFIYQGIGLSLSTVVHTWGLHLEGACPLSIAIAAVMTVIFLGDALYLGSIIGAIILSIGFYAVIWAKAKEDLSEYSCCDSLGSSSDGKTPLLDSSLGSSNNGTA
ncbi:wat1-related protein [Quercus suber]|uniref:Wat1-related protein n=1 Tax=Quercus suber TaxID=58331 RepID=A0AAW0JAX8_QUESU